MYKVMKSFHETYSSVGKLLHKLLISLTQPTFLPLTFRSLSETFVRTSTINSSSGSCQDSDATWQEIGRTCGSASSCSRPGSRIVVPPFEYVLPL